MKGVTMSEMKTILFSVLMFLAATLPGYTAEIHQAVMAGDFAKVKVILDKNPSLVNTSEDGITPVLYAAYQENRKMVNFLVSRGARTDMFVVTIIGDKAKVKSFLDANPNLVNAKDQNGQTPLHWAANKGHIQIVKMLVSLGAKINLKDNTGWTPIEYAEEMQRKDVVKFLKQKGAQ